MRERLTTDKTKIFARENLTLMSITKDELRKLYNEVFDRLQEYEVAEEQGQIIVPPCKVGDEVYHIRQGSCENVDGRYTICKFYRHAGKNLCALPKGKCPHKYIIVKCNVTRDNLLIVTEKWGKTVFLTKEEAEQALKGGAE